METYTKLMLPIPEACLALGLGRSRFYQEVTTGRIRTVTVGRRRLVPVAALGEFIALLESEAAGAA